MLVIIYQEASSMFGFKSQVGEFWGGYCPDCMIVESEMMKNLDNKWECPICHLQVSVSDKRITILSQVGTGRFARKHGSRISVLTAIPPQEGRITENLRI
jgi:hypothetical protein